MRNTVFVLAGLLLVLCQEHFFRFVRLLATLFGVLHIPTAVFALPGITPAFPLPLILFMGVHELEFPLLRGASLAFVIGYTTDLVGMAPVGLYTFTYVALFVTARGAGIRLASQARWMQLALTFGFALGKGATVLGLLAVFGKDTWVPRVLWKAVFPHAIATALVGPFVFYLGTRLLGVSATASKGDRGLVISERR